MKGLVWIGLMTSVATCPARAAIFGADNRYRVNERSSVLPMARATAIAVLSSNVSVNKTGGLDLDTDVLTNFCADETSVAGQPSLSYSCTGFLIAPDLLVTAGHCVYAVNTPNKEIKHESGLACAAYAWLFDYQGSTTGPTVTKNLSADRLYHCKEIIYAKQSESLPYEDYALIRLDRPALGRTPFVLAPTPMSSAGKPTGAVPGGSLLAMLGYPFGTPLTYTDGAHVTTNNPARGSFLTTLDAFEGNSGSPVFNSAHQVVGILVGGTPIDNTYTTKAGCEKLNRCTENGLMCNSNDAPSNIAKVPSYQGVGSEVQRIQPIVDLVVDLSVDHLKTN